MPKRAPAKPAASSDDIQSRAKRMEETNQKYLVELAAFKRKQRELLEKFIKELEKRKIEEIKKSLQK